ncbi:MAG: type II secretion system protein GspL [Enterobacteriaceae bacterium]
MANLLLLRLGHDLTEPVEWFWRAGNQPHECCDGQLASMYLLPSLADYIQQSQVTVLIPGDAVLFRKVQLNGKINSQTLKALPYLIEESLISDVEQLHLVILAREQSNFYLMGVDIQQLQLWLGGLKEAGIVPQRLLPDVLAVPYSSENWNACRLGDQWIIRTELYSGVAIKTEWVDSLVTAWSDMPSVTAYSEDPVVPHHWQRGEPAGIRLLAQQPLEYLPNLLQGRFKPKVSNTTLHRWTLVAGLALGGVLFSLVNIGLDGYQQQQQVQRLKQQQLTLYHQLLPQAPGMVDDPREQLQKQLDRLQVSALEPGFIWLIKEAAPLLRQLPPMTLHALQYQSHPAALELTLKGVNEKQLQAWSDKSAMNLQIEIKATPKSNPPAEGMLTVILREKHV